MSSEAVRAMRAQMAREGAAKDRKPAVAAEVTAMDGYNTDSQD